MKYIITLLVTLSSFALISSEPDVDYHVVDAFYIDNNRIELELNYSLDGLGLRKVIMEAKAKELAQADLIINGVTVDKKLVASDEMQKVIFNTSNNAVTFGYNLDSIEVETHGAIAIEQFALEAK